MTLQHDSQDMYHLSCKRHVDTVATSLKYTFEWQSAVLCITCICGATHTARRKDSLLNVVSYMILLTTYLSIMPLSQTLRHGVTVC